MSTTMQLSRPNRAGCAASAHKTRGRRERRALGWRQTDLIVCATRVAAAAAAAAVAAAAVAVAARARAPAGCRQGRRRSYLAVARQIVAMRRRRR